MYKPSSNRYFPKMKKNSIQAVSDNLKSQFGTDNVYAIGRAAEVMRGLFPTTHILQFFIYDPKAVELPHPPGTVNQLSRALGAFNQYLVLPDCLVYGPEFLSPAVREEFNYQLTRTYCIDELTAVRYPSFELNYQIQMNNPWFHIETTVSMDSIAEYLNSGVGEESDIPMVGALHRYIQTPASKRDPSGYHQILEMLTAHKHAKLLVEIFHETLEAEKA